MIRLHQTFGAHTGRVFDFDQPVVRLGRLPDNEVSFDPHADLDASGRHAEIRQEGGQWVVVDVGSRNGTLVQGQRVTRQILRDGDEIEFGLGGPRVRVELSVASTPRGAMTAQATPVGYPTGPATPLGHPSPAGVAPPTALPAGAGLDSIPVGPAVHHPTPPPSPFAGEPIPTPGAVVHAPLSGPPMQQGAPPQHVPGMHPRELPQMSPPPGAPMGGPPPGERRYGQRTVGMMIQAAVEQADRQRSQGGNRSTAFIRAVAQEAAHSSSRGLKIALALIALLLFLTLGAVVALFFYARWQEQDLRDENVRLQRELAELGDGESSERGRLEQRIQRLNDQLSGQQQETGSSIAARNDRAVWVLLRTRRGGHREVVCTAFSVRPDLLATNAHCVGALERAMASGEEVRASPNHGGDALTIERMWRHPSYVASAPASPDVGLLRVRGTMPQQVQLATMSELSQVSTGDDVFVLGFSAALADEGAPVAGMTSGVVGRLTAFDGTEAPAPMRHLVSHSAFTDDGTAGSPLFDRQGRVVAINAGNFRARRRVVDTNTRVSRTVESDTPFAWAVRSDLLLQLLAGLPPR